MTNLSNKKLVNASKRAFTLVELIIIIVVMVIVGLLASPMLSSAADIQVRSAASILSADLEYAKSMAISRQQNYAVVFDAANNSYQVEVLDAADSGTVIAHPGRPGSLFVVDFDNDSRISRVDITAADFDSQQTITFDYLGSPYSAAGTGTPLSSGSVTLNAEAFSVSVVVEPMTGYITIE